MFTSKSSKPKRTPAQYAVAAVAALAALVTLPGEAQSQTIRPPAHITVSKAARNDEDAGMFTTVQAAVNAAKPGQIIEIIDTEVYEEQVTIDGRDNSPWAGVTGGKHGITIRSSRPTDLVKPTIKWRDITNRSPRTYDESQVAGELPGNSGNFETCGALRIIRAQGITIDGIAVDGGGPAPFGWPEIWNRKDELTHGNAAITVVVAGGAIIKNCRLYNAYYGINIKDRNTGGVFGNPNPADNDHTVPLSGFGKVGNHLFEHNRIHDNSLAFFFESAWDLGSTVRHNLIYNNFHTEATKTLLIELTTRTTPKPLGDNHINNMAFGVIMFKDMVYTPIAFYNNTLYRNYANLIGHWKIGAQHLIFNNIFGPSNVSSYPSSGLGSFPDAMGLDVRFPNRMHNTLFSGYVEVGLQQQRLYVDACTPQNYDTLWVRDVRVWNNFAAPATSPQTISWAGCPPGAGYSASVVQPGAIMSQATGIPAEAGVRWLEVAGRTLTHTQSGMTLTYPSLFESIDPGALNFLRPKWSDPLAQQFIQNKGWADIGIRNSNGQIADIGAVPSAPQLQTIARIKPTNVVLLSGTNAEASFYLTVEDGRAFKNPKIKFLRWVAPLTEVTDNWGQAAPIVAAGNIHNIPIPTASLSVGTNSVRFTIPRAMTDADRYGFFEMVIEGEDESGTTIATDVGFLPYRQLDYILDIQVVNSAGAVVPNPVVTAGMPVTVRVSAMERRAGGDVAFDGRGNTTRPLPVEYQLLSDPTAMMWREIDPQGNPLVSDPSILTGNQYSKTYTVHFTKAGDEVISGAGVWAASGSADADQLPFLGTLNLTVLPGAPDKVTFISPIPKSQLPDGALPPAINRGVNQEVLVEVQDKWGNPVNQAVDVTISSANVTQHSGLIGDAGAPGNLATKTVKTDPATGMATFAARVMDGAPARGEFDLTATMGGSTDVGRLRVGRTLDRLVVLYNDGGGAWEDDLEYVISGKVGSWYQVYVRAVAGSDLLDRTQFIRVDTDYDLVFSAAEGGAATNVFSMAGGVASFWVKAADDVSSDVRDACITVTALLTSSPTDVDASIEIGSRCDISFEMPTSAIDHAIVYGDGHGRPDSVVITYMSELAGIPPPDSVSLRWPIVVGGSIPFDPVTISVPQSRIRVSGDFTLVVDFRPDADKFRGGFTDITGVSTGAMKVFGGVGGAGMVHDFFEVWDGISPVIADSKDEKPGRTTPMIVENPAGGTVQDTLLICISEDIKSGLDMLESGTSIFYTDTPNDPATGGTALNIQRVQYDQTDTHANRFKLTLAAGSVVAPGGWIRLNPASGITDLAERGAHPSNGVHPNSRWVQVELKPIPPTIDSSRTYYTSDVTTGLLDYAYIAFNKKINAGGSAWFTGGSIKIESEEVSVGIDPDRFLHVMEDDSTVLRIAISEFQTVTSAIRTSGFLGVAIKFNPGFGWDEMSVPGGAKDRAKPVIAGDVVELKYGIRRPEATEPDFDTLVVTYSERMSVAALNKPNPVTIQGRGTPTLTLIRSSSVGTYQRVEYLIDRSSITVSELMKDDSVFINIDAGLDDDVAPPNTQDQPNNRRVPLKIDFNIQWQVKVKNNPFNAGSGSKSVVVLDPDARGLDKFNINATIRVFDKLGNLVVNKKESFDNVVEWEWDGRNTKGRLVGTGTYLVKITAAPDTEDVPRFTGSKQVMVVRK